MKISFVQSAALFLVAGLAACGGAQDDSTHLLAKKVVVVPPNNGATSITANITEGDRFQLSSTVTSLITGTTYLSDLAGIALPASESITSQAGSKFLVKFTTNSNLLAGQYSGSIKFNVCTQFKKLDCKKFAKDSPILIPYSITVTSRPTTAWSTAQGNEKHNGYVPVTLDPTKFVKVWEWTTPNGSRISPVSIENGKVAVSDDGYFSQQAVWVFRTSDGSNIWSRAFTSAIYGSIPAINPPAMKDGVVYVATSGHEDTFMYALDATTGAEKFKAPFSSQWEHYLAPTVVDGSVLTAGGYYGGANSFSLTGAQQWFVPGYGYDMFSPAVNGIDAYFYDARGLYVINRADGAVRFTIGDPGWEWYGYSDHTSPIVGTNNNVITYSGSNFSGTASNSTDGYKDRNLINFDLTAKTISWRSANKYISQPALDNSTLYAGRLGIAQLDALNEVDGSIKWSWVAPNGDTRSCRNVVATQNLLFFSTDYKVYAMDINTRQVLWTYPFGGDLATDGNTLIVNIGCRESAGKMVAFKLR